jgi:hypothetical protein
MTVPRNLVWDTLFEGLELSSTRLRTQSMMQPFWFAGQTLLYFRLHLITFYGDCIHEPIVGDIF